MMLKFVIVLLLTWESASIYYLHAIQLMGNSEEFRSFFFHYELMAYVFVFFVGGGLSGWRSLECLVVALFLVNHHLNFMALVEHNLYLPALQASGSGFIFAINFWLH